MGRLRLNRENRIKRNSGFGINAGDNAGRFINKDGSANVIKKGLRFFDRTSWYHKMLELSHGKFFFVIFLFYLFMNLLFGMFYFWIGVEHLKGVSIHSSEWENFGNAFFFSIQTFTTVGYGHISPEGFLSSALASIEALIGLLSFGIFTGLFFGRFSMPRAYIKFAENALISPYNESKALMIRMSPFKNTNFTEAEAKLTLGMVVNENGKQVNKFYSLDLEMNKINTLTLSWTLVHPITKDSPLYGFEEKDFKEIKGEIIVFFKTFDDMFSTVVSSQTSYLFSEVIYGARYNVMYSQNENKTTTILHVNKLNDFSYCDMD